MNEKLKIISVIMSLALFCEIAQAFEFKGIQSGFGWRFSEKKQNSSVTKVNTYHETQFVVPSFALEAQAGKYWLTLGTYLQQTQLSKNRDPENSSLDLGDLKLSISRKLGKVHGRLAVQIPLYQPGIPDIDPYLGSGSLITHLGLYIPLILPKNSKLKIGADLGGSAVLTEGFDYGFVSVPTVALLGSWVLQSSLKISYQLTPLALVYTNPHFQHESWSWQAGISSADEIKSSIHISAGSKLKITRLQSLQLETGTQIWSKIDLSIGDLEYTKRTRVYYGNLSWRKEF